MRVILLFCISSMLICCEANSKENTVESFFNNPSSEIELPPLIINKWNDIYKHYKPYIGIIGKYKFSLTESSISFINEKMSADYIQNNSEYRLQMVRLKNIKFNQEIKLGISKSEVFEKFGNNYEELLTNDFDCISYKIKSKQKYLIFYFNYTDNKLNHIRLTFN